MLLATSVGIAEIIGGYSAASAVIVTLTIVATNAIANRRHKDENNQKEKAHEEANEENWRLKVDTDLYGEERSRTNPHPRDGLITSVDKIAASAEKGAQATTELVNSVDLLLKRVESVESRLDRAGVAS